jgi:hypothetical protein
MVDRQFIVVQLVAETRRWPAPPQLGLGDPRIDGNYRSTI